MRGKINNFLKGADRDFSDLRCPWCMSRVYAGQYN